MLNLKADPKELKLLLETKMPFGRYAGWPLIKLPEPYVVWFYNKGFPKGKLGRLLGLLYEIKVNGLESMLYKLLPHQETKAR